MPDGEVMIPDASLTVQKQKLKDNYMEILKDVVSAEAASVGTRALKKRCSRASTTLALPASPKVLLLMPHVELRA
jgi:hypothetical protein